MLQWDVWKESRGRYSTGGRSGAITAFVRYYAAPGRSDRDDDASRVPCLFEQRWVGCRKPMPPGDTHGSCLLRGHAAGPGNGPSRRCRRAVGGAAWPASGQTCISWEHGTLLTQRPVKALEQPPMVVQCPGKVSHFRYPRAPGVRITVAGALVTLPGMRQVLQSRFVA